MPVTTGEWLISLGALVLVALMVGALEVLIRSALKRSKRKKYDEPYP